MQYTTFDSVQGIIIIFFGILVSFCFNNSFGSQLPAEASVRDRLKLYKRKNKAGAQWEKLLGRSIKGRRRR
jgi:hypothetical protein